MKRLEPKKILTWFFDRIRYPFGKPTPHKEGEIRYVSGTRRHIGTLIDLTIVVIMMQLFYSVFFVAFPSSESTFKVVEKYKMGIELREDEKPIRNRYIYKVVALQVLQLIFLVVYHAYMWVKFSGTIGKLLLGLKVLDEDTLAPMSAGQALKRVFSVVLSGIPLGLGIIWSSFNRKKKTWHDMLAHTVVVTSKSLKQYQELQNQELQKED